MKREEFFQLIDEYGIDLNKLSIAIDSPSGWEGDHGVYEENGQWIYFSADGRNRIDKELLASEDEAFDKIMTDVDYDLRSFTNRNVTREIAKLPKKDVCEFLQKEYALTLRQAIEAWDYLKQDMNVLFEFKYYIVKGEFVPEKYCYKVKGYSAEQLYKTSYLEVLGAFNYLIYLKRKPNEALAALKAGLPRK